MIKSSYRDIDIFLRTIIDKPGENITILDEKCRLSTLHCVMNYTVTLLTNLCKNCNSRLVNTINNKMNKVRNEKCAKCGYSGITI